MDDTSLFPGLDFTTAQGPASATGGETSAGGVGAADTDVGAAGPRLRRPDRQQARLVPCVLEELLAADHPARAVWAVVQQLDLARFEAGIRARGAVAGQSAIDPQLLVALWLYAYTQGIGGGRELARRCQSQDAYRWLCGGVSVCYHTLNDFRVGHEPALDDLFTQVLAVLMHQKLVQVQRISQDGTKVRASAGAASFRRGATLEKLLVQARQHVAQVKAQAQEAEEPARATAARQAAARDRQRRIEQALAELPKVQAVKEKAHGKAKAQAQPARASTTDPEARVMKMADGGFRPAVNVQLAADPQSKAIVAVAVTNQGTDHGQDQGLRQQVEERTGQKVQEQLMDGGFVSRDSLEQAAEEGVTVYAPVAQPRKPGIDPYAAKVQDGPAVAAWRQRMGTAPAQAIYKERAATSELVNADVKTHRGLGRLTVRGLTKARCVVLWAALAYNVLHFAAALAGAGA
jgi:transposase